MDCGLKSITIPTGVTSIESGAFSACQALKTISVASGNKVYDSRNNCNAIIETETNTLVAGCKNTVIPNNVTSIGDYAFNQCSGLTSISIPAGVTSIGEGAFNCCDGLESIIIPKSVMSIGVQAFSECSSLTSVTISEGVTSIEQWAFYCCSNLTSITIPASVTFIGDEAIGYDADGFDRCVIKGFVIHGVNGSEAEQYAKDNGISFVGESIPGCIHKWEAQYTVDTPATCKAEGSESIHCSECGAIQEGSSRIIKKTDHQWDKGKVTKAATTTAAGLKTITCTVCGETKTEAIPKLEKKANPLKIKVSKKTYKSSKLKKAASFSIGASKAQGKVTYTLDKKAKKAKIKVSKKGKVTIPKKCKKGTYKITVKAAGNKNYKAGKKTVTIKVK